MKIKEFYQDGKEEKRRSIMEIPKEKMKYFVLYNYNNPEEKIVIELKHNEEVIYFRRHFHNILTSSEDLVYVVGIKNKETNESFYLFITQYKEIYVRTDSNFGLSMKRDKEISLI